eukprot:UN19499
MFSEIYWYRLGKRRYNLIFPENIHILIGRLKQNGNILYYKNWMCDSLGPNKYNDQIYRIVEKRKFA